MENTNKCNYYYTSCLKPLRFTFLIKSLIRQLNFRFQTTAEFLDTHVNMPYTDLSINSHSFLQKWQPYIQQNWLINCSSNKQRCRNQKVRSLRQYRRYRADFTKGMSKYVHLTDWLADFIMLFFCISVINCRIKRWNLIILPSDCPFNHHGEVFSSKERPEKKKDSIRSLSYILFFVNNQWTFFKQNSALRSLIFLKSFCLVTSWSGKDLEIPNYMFESSSIIVFSSMYVKCMNADFFEAFSYL